MNVLMLIRATAFDVQGGDTIQARATARYLRHAGVEVDLKLTSESIDYSEYQLIHFFNIIRPADILPHIEKSKLPFVISPIFVDYSEFDKKARKGIAGSLARLVSNDFLEYLKAIARMAVNKEMIRSRDYLLWGHKKSIRYLIKNSSFLLPNSESEIMRLFNHYNIRNKYNVIPNGIDTEIFKEQNTPEKKRNGVICVGQIHGLKNQLNLIRAMNKTDLPLTIIGKPTLNGKSYYEQCRRQAGGNIRFVNFLAQEELVKCYRQAKVHVLPSWFETTGLSSLEAAAMGCNIVITRKGDAFEYFGDLATYCEPESVESIRQAVLDAHSRQASPGLRDMIFARYTWKKAAEATLEAYKTTLS
ncbi:MAG: glycosyltransferase [Bacteroidia bacterium]